MAGNKSKKHMSNIISNFFVLKIFNIQTREGRVVSFMDVIWQVSSTNWLKVNTDGVTKGYFGLIPCVSIFRGSRGEYMGSFSAFLGYKLLFIMSL